MEKKYRRRLLLLREWRRIVYSVASVVKKLYPETELYLIGGVAENRITIDSDIDIAVVFRSKLNENDRVNILMHIWEAIENTIPMYYPLEIHIFNLNEFVRLKGRKIKLI